MSSLIVASRFTVSNIDYNCTIVQACARKKTTPLLSEVDKIILDYVSPHLQKWYNFCEWRNIYHSCSSTFGLNEFLNCGRSVIICSRPASPNCPGSLFTFIHQSCILLSLLPMHTRLMAPWAYTWEETVSRVRYFSTLVRPYCLELPFPRSDRSFALLTGEKEDW